MSEMTELIKAAKEAGPYILGFVLMIGWFWQRSKADEREDKKEAVYQGIIEKTTGPTIDLVREMQGMKLQVIDTGAILKEIAMAGTKSNELAERLGEALISHDIQARGIKAEVSEVGTNVKATKEAVEAVQHQIDEMKAMIAEAQAKFQAGVSDELSKLWTNLSAKFDQLGELIKSSATPSDPLPPPDHPETVPTPPDEAIKPGA